jgi:hypothetical protein
MSLNFKTSELFYNLVDPITKIGTKHNKVFWILNYCASIFTEKIKKREKITNKIKSWSNIETN